MISSPARAFFMLPMCITSSTAPAQMAVRIFAGASPKRYISRGRAMPTVMGKITVQSKIYMTAHPVHSTIGTYFNPQ